MISASMSPQGPRWYSIPVRVLLLTLIATLLSFAVGLLLGILGVVLAATFRGVHPDLRFAYRDVAAPAGLAIGTIALVSSTFVELRHYRRERMLSHIEHQIGRAS